MSENPFCLPMETPCPLCGEGLRKTIEFDLKTDIAQLDCIGCGNHRIARNAIEDVGQWTGRPEKQARIGFSIRRLKSDVVVTSEMVSNFAKSTMLPSASELLDNLVLHFGSNRRPGAIDEAVSARELKSALGVIYTPEAAWVMEQAKIQGLLDGDPTACQNLPRGMFFLSNAALSSDGWARYEELMRNGAGSRHAFMAMDFKAPDIRELFNDYMRGAVAETGFDLRTTQGDHQTAGSIDNRMRVEIRTARFVICDLSHGNRGAYWEAGFAEGLGRPVFYTCRRNVLEAKDHPDVPHFDTRQQLIIPWDADNPGPAMKELKSTIRATLPAEAKMEDELLN